MREKILPSSQLKAWREALDENVAVVTGTFDLLQPGNLLAIEEAKRRAAYICVALEPDAAAGQGPRNPLPVRQELLAALKDAAIVTAPTPREIQDLRPYLLVDCLSQPADTPLHQAARDSATEVVKLPPLPGCFTRDIVQALRNNTTPIAVNPKKIPAPPTRADLERRCARQPGQTLVTVNGCFDLLHVGHVRLLTAARQKGRSLIALVNDDASVRTYKGSTRPVFPIHFRLAALQALTSVSLAYPFSGDNPLDLLAAIRPDIHVKGGSFEEDRVRQERELLARWGGRLEFIPLVEGFSTTNLMDALRNR